MRSRCGIRCIFVLLILIIGVSVANSQTRQITLWRDVLNQIQALPADALYLERDTLSRIRAGVEFWIRSRPNTTISLDAASDDPAREVRLLTETVAKIIEEDNGQPFVLGVTSISVTAEASPLSPITDSISYNEITDRRIVDVTEAVQNLPGLAIDRSASRNQTGIMIRGFNTRQVGLYLDNIPIMVPYNGTADIGRFLASDIATVDVAKGYSSPLIGPNGLGGAINLVTRQPGKKFEGDMMIGTGSGDMLESGVHIGSRHDKFFFRAGMDWIQTDYFPLSGKAPLYGPQANYGYERLASDRRDARYSGRFGWTPRGEDQYVFTFTRQEADYGMPPYSGWNNNRANYWRWEYWNRDSYYLNTNTGLGDLSSIKFRAFVDFYPNQMNMYSTGFETLQSWSSYDDHSEGFGSEFNTRVIPRNNLSVSFFFKKDTHEEFDTTPSNTGINVGPKRRHGDYVTSLGFQDIISISSRLRATVGMSLDNLNASIAQNIVNNTLVPFDCNGEPGESFSSCLAHKWTANPLASLSYSTGESGTLFFTFALKSRFPTMMNRYSYRNNSAIPNPSVGPEYSRNYSLGYMHSFGQNTIGQVEFFRSDIYDEIQSALIPETLPNQCPANYIEGFCTKAVNVGKALNQGVELTLRSSPIRNLQINTNYTYLQRKIDNIPELDQPVFPVGTPKHRVTGAAEYQLPRNIMILASARYEAGVFTVATVNNQPYVKVPSSNYAVADLGGVFPVGRGFKIQAGAKNLFDRYYYYAEGFPEAGRTWYLNVRYNF